MRITRVDALPLWASFADVYGGADKVPGDVSHPAFGMRVTPLGGQGCVIVRVHTDEGLVGVGESSGRPGPRATAAYIEDILAPILLGSDPRRVEVHWQAMNEHLSFAPMAISGVDAALWDLRGQIYGAPLAELLGGPFELSIACYASPIPYLPTPVESAQRARQFLDDGFGAVKLKIGRGVDVDLEHVAAVRDEIGPAVKLLVDCNGAYMLPESVVLGKGLVRHGAFWFEEPIHRNFREDLAELRRRVDLPIASGEWLNSVFDFQDLIDDHGADVLMPNITRCGGVTGFLRVAEAAQLRNLAIAPHGVGAGVGILAAVHASASIANFLIYEYNQLVNPLRRATLDGPLHFSDSRLTVPTEPGLGAKLNDAAIARFIVGCGEQVAVREGAYDDPQQDERRDSQAAV